MLNRSVIPFRACTLRACTVIFRPTSVATCTLGAGLILTLLFSAGCGTSAEQTGAGGGGRGRGRGRGDGGNVPVVTGIVGQKDVPVNVAAIGNVEAIETITVQAQVTGQLVEVLFHEGDFVKKGDHLFTLDRRPLEAQLQQLEANVARDQALGSQAEANLARDAAQAEYQQLTSERNSQLQQQGIISKDLSDQMRASADASAALVKADRAAIESARATQNADQAAAENASVQLGYTVIYSPVDGRTGNLMVKAGNLVTANATQLMTIQEIQPIYVTFAVPATHLPTIKRFMATGSLSVVAVPQDADAQPSTGRLTFVDNAVDPTTDTIKLKATFENAERRFWPGQFARVTLRLTTLSQATVVPNQAVQTGQNGQFVFVVKPDSTVELRNITTSETVDQDTVVDTGLKPGETVVTEGQLRLEPGTKVQPRGAGDAGGAGRGRGGRSAS